MAALAQEITAEINPRGFRFLRTLSGTAVETYDPAGVTGTATFVGDEHAALAVPINRAANLIAPCTRRGAGNYAVVKSICINNITTGDNQVFQEQQKVHLKHQQILNRWNFK